MSLTEIIANVPTEHLGNIFGQFDKNLKLIERTLNVSIVLRDDRVKISGEEADVKSASDVLNELLELSVRGNTITEQNVIYALSLKRMVS